MTMPNRKAPHPSQSRQAQLRQDPAIEFPLGYQPLHVVMRYSEQFLGVEDTVAEHAKVIKKRGSVAVGKFGRPLANKWVERLNRQIAAGFKTSLYLVKKAADVYVTHQLNVVLVTRDIDLKLEKTMPAYYLDRSVRARMTMWFLCDSVSGTGPRLLDSLHVASSGYSVRRAIHTSMAGMFVVRDGPGLGYI